MRCNASAKGYNPRVARPPAGRAAARLEQLGLPAIPDRALKVEVSFGPSWWKSDSCWRNVELRAHRVAEASDHLDRTSTASDATAQVDRLHAVSAAVAPPRQPR